MGGERSAVGTTLHKMGFSLLEIQRYLGHRSWRTTTLYVQVDDRRMEEAAQQLGGVRKQKIRPKTDF